MRAVVVRRFGGPGVLEPAEWPDPVAGPGQIVVDVAAADTLFLDIALRRGDDGPWRVRPPYVPGAGVAGTVSQAGPGVAEEWIGRRVVAKSNAGGPRPDSETIVQAAARTTPTGGYAERAIANVSALVPVPDELGLVEAAALVNDGMTAMLLTGTARIQPGEWVLVTPAGGGLGSLLVQLAAAAGARVVGAAGSGEKLDQARRLGAQVVVDYTKPDWTDLVRDATGGSGPNVVLDGVGGAIGASSAGLTARGGRFVGFGVPNGGFTIIDPAEALGRGITARSLLHLRWSRDDERRLPRQAIAAAAAGRIRAVVGQTFALDQAAEAHAAIEARQVLGKTVLLT